jgi:hypothetical protein
MEIGLPVARILLPNGKSESWAKQTATSAITLLSTSARETDGSYFLKGVKEHLGTCA